jgi:hypothetical protein
MLTHGILNMDQAFKPFIFVHVFKRFFLGTILCSVSTFLFVVIFRSVNCN